MKTNYALKYDHSIGKLAIQARSEGEQSYVPIGFIFEGDAGFPLDMVKLGDNLRALLNDQEPPHRIEAGNHRIFYQKAEGAVVLRWQENGAGTTRPGPIITVSEPASTADLGQELLRKMNRHFMTRFCDAVESDDLAAAASSSTAPRPALRP